MVKNGKALENKFNFILQELLPSFLVGLMFEISLFWRHPIALEDLALGM